MLRNLIDVIPFGTVGDIIVARIARLRQRAPVVLATQIAVAPADIGLVHARLALLIGAGEQDADRVAREGAADDPRYFGGDRIAVVARRIIDTFDRQAAAQDRKSTRLNSSH